MSINVWFTSDLHLGHRKVAALRGFGEDTNAHDTEIVDRWNSVVDKKDIVWVLGDVAISQIPKALTMVKNMNGTKHLIAGNHDMCHSMHRDSHKNIPRYMESFETVQAFAKRRWDTIEYLLSHFPYHGDHEGSEPRFTQYRLRDEGMWLLHGHTHGPERKHGYEIHVGMDAWHLTPVPLDTIIELMKAE